MSIIFYVSVHLLNRAPESFQLCEEKVKVRSCIGGCGIFPNRQIILQALDKGLSSGQSRNRAMVMGMEFIIVNTVFNSDQITITVSFHTMRFHYFIMIIITHNQSHFTQTRLP